MNFVDWAQVISAAGTVIAAGVAAFTTRLTLKQLRYQFSPHLLIASERFQVRMCQTSIKDLFWEQPTEEARYGNIDLGEYAFRLTNTGAGAAHDVRIFAEFDFEAVYHDISRKISGYTPPLEIEQEDWGAKILFDGEHIGGFKNPDEAFGVVDYVRPCRDERVEARFIIDPTLSFFALIYGTYLMREKVNSGVSQPAQNIDVDFVIKYSDASGAELEQRHPHRMTISGGRWTSDMSDGVCLISLHKRR
ncbi:hypothetical protein [Rhizobium leguminosarum]